MVDNYINVIKKYAVFKGVAGRKEFWLFVLAYFLIYLVFWLPGLFLGKVVGGLLMIPLLLIMLATIVPYYAVMARRLHDTGRSAWWVLLGFVPIAGLVLLVFLALPTAPSPNRYAADVIPTGVF